jgi:hypothetical protein
MLRAFRGIRHTSPKSNLTKEKRLASQTSKNELLLAETDSGYRESEGKGVGPSPFAGRVSLTRDRP